LRLFSWEALKKLLGAAMRRAGAISLGRRGGGKVFNRMRAVAAYGEGK
jgi:hypothetical protein